MRAHIAALIFLIPSVAMSSEPQQKTISTPDGEIHTTTTTVDPVPQQIVVVGPEEIKAFNAYASQGIAFVSAYIPGIKNPTLKDFDEAFRLWQKEKKQRYSQQQVTEILGAYLGNILIKDLKMEWVVVTDEYGTDYAVRAKQYEVLSFPFSSVLKRIESNQHDFMVGVYHTIKASINDGEYKRR